MRFQNTAYMTNGFSERIPAAQKLMILDGINNARLFPECDYLQVFKLMPTDHEGRRAQKIVHTQEQPPYEKEYILLTDEIVTEKVFVKLGRAYQDNDLVYCYDDGTPRSTNGFSGRFSEFLEKNGLRHIRFHDLRHINATLMLQYGVPAKIASERLGHSTIQTTMNIYSHVTVEMQKDTVNIFDNNIFSKVAER